MIAFSLIKTVSSFHSKRVIAKDFTLQMSTSKVHKKVHVLVPIGNYPIIQLSNYLSTLIDWKCDIYTLCCAS